MANTILIVDDEPDILDIHATWLRNSGYEVLQAVSGAEAISLAKQRAVDVVITDLRMPGLSGLHLLTILKEIAPSIEVVLLSGQGTMEDAIEALREGRAFDFLRKPLYDLGRLNLTIEKALKRRSTHPAPAGEVRPVVSPDQVLSVREREVLNLVAQGLENREIAGRLSISDKTVKNHLARTYQKLNVSNRTQAVTLCQRLGLL
ncbi:MAG TPA: response regulator transcription factor [Pantanalinema sp.]